MPDKKSGREVSYGMKKNLPAELIVVSVFSKDLIFVMLKSERFSVW